jgi:hypothetical protein
MSNNSYLIEEYRALRAELLTLTQRQTQRMGLTWAGVAALLTTASITHLPELGFLGLILVASGWLDHMSLSSGIYRIAAYIKIFLESNLEGLNWERVLYNIFHHNRILDNRSKRLIQALLCTYSIFAFTCITVIIGLLGSYGIPRGSRFLLFIVLALLGFFLWGLCIKQALTRLSDHDKWTKIFIEAKKNNSE